MGFKEEILKRRTFGIISHPDAGKTTLTEKLLLFGGAIHVAGAVKSNKIKKTATSDFMEIERQRGISVATSVMGFEYKDVKINILDTPGHQDFAEDTFRVLTACDSVIIVVDSAKGVETQTRKLMQVCRMRKTPVIVFINKLDRPGQDPFDLLDEIEKELQIQVTPLSWPIGNGDQFKGIYNIHRENLCLYSASVQTIQDGIEINDINSGELDEHIGERSADKLREDLELVREVYPAIDRAAYLDGQVAPVFFGSALNNFGIREMLDCFIEIAPSPLPRETDERLVQPDEEKFTGFVFKIHANMDPNHRDRIAFVKVCSGVFRRNTNYLHVGLGKNLKFSTPTAFMASKKSIIDEAYPGDIVGLHDTGNFKIGDTLTDGENLHFKGIPIYRERRPHEIQATGQGYRPAHGRGCGPAVHEPVQQPQDHRNRWRAPVRGHRVPFVARVQRGLSLGKHQSLQGLLDRGPRPEGTGRLPPPQGTVHGQGQMGARCLPRRIAVHAANGTGKLQETGVSLYIGVLGFIRFIKFIN